MFRISSIAVGFVLVTYSFSVRDVEARADEGGRVTHFALISTGPAFNEHLEMLYWGVNETIYRVLRNYGYPHEAIIQLSERGRNDSRRVDGRSSLENFRSAFRHLAKITQPDDHVMILLVGHGAPANGDFITPFIDGELSATELGELVEPIQAKNMTLILHPCFSGGFIPNVSGPGRVVVTSTIDKEVNGVPWAEAFVEAFAPESKKDTDSDGRVAILEAYVASLRPGKDRYGSDLREHPLLDDNGDGVGHFGGLPLGGDGSAARKRFLGDQGRPLQFEESAIEQLRQSNSTMLLK